MKTIKKEFKISFIKNENNYNNVKEVYCDSKSIFNYIMLVLSILFAIVCGYFMIKIFYFDFSDNRLNINFTNLLCLFGVLLLIIAPAVYFILKIVNFLLAGLTSGLSKIVVSLFSFFKTVPP